MFLSDRFLRAGGALCNTYFQMSDAAKFNAVIYPIVDLVWRLLGEHPNVLAIGKG